MLLSVVLHIIRLMGMWSYLGADGLSRLACIKIC